LGTADGEDEGCLIIAFGCKSIHPEIGAMGCLSTYYMNMDSHAGHTEGVCKSFEKCEVRLRRGAKANCMSAYLFDRAGFLEMVNSCRFDLESSTSSKDGNFHVKDGSS
jgi:hypothetical protein